MILDDNLVSIDGASLTSAITPKAIPLTSLLKPGREEPIPVCVKVTETAAGGTSIAIKLQQADTETGTYAEVPGSAATVALANLTKGNLPYLRWLPPGVTKPWLKVVVTATGTFTAGKIFAAVVREDELPYEAGMYIDKGVVVG